MKKYAAFATGFALIFALLFLHQCGRSKESELLKQANESRYISKLAIADKEIGLRDSVLVALQNDRKDDSVRHTKENARLSGALNASKRRERNSRADTITISLTDTIYMKYDTLVANLKNERDSLKISFETSIDTLKANFQTMKGKFKLADEARDSLKNLKPDSNWGLGLTGGVGAIVSDGVVRAGPGVVVGLSYRIPIKISLKRLFRRHRK